MLTATHQELAEFHLWLAKNYRPSTAAKYLGIVVAFQSWWEEHTGRPFKCQAWRKHHTEAYWDHIAEETAPTTLRTRAAALRRYGQWVFNSDLVADNPYVPPPQPMTDTIAQIRWLTKTQEQKLLTTLAARRDDAVGQRDYLLCLLFLQAGLRVREASSLRISGVNQQEECLLIKQHESYRRVPLSTELQEVLASYLPTRTNGGYLILSRTMKQMGPRAMSHRIQLWRQWANLAPWVSLTTLRQTYCRRQIEKGTPLEEVARLIGYTRSDGTPLIARLKPYLDDKEDSA